MHRSAVPALVAIATVTVLLIGALAVPLEVRNSAPFGFNLTLDAERGIAVTGRRVVPNYPNFNRVDLDLRSYTMGDAYDLTLYIQPDERGATPIRTIPLTIPASQIYHRKAPFAVPFTTVRFPPIANSAGQPYEVWVERGTRNRDDVIAVWSFKTYSRVTGRLVLGALLNHPAGTAAPGAVGAVLTLLLLGFVAAVGWLMGGLTAYALRWNHGSPGRPASR